MNAKRLIGVGVGVVFLLSVVSVLQPIRGRPPQAVPCTPSAMSRTDLARLDQLQRTTRSQRDEVVVLTTETRRLSDLITARQLSNDLSARQAAESTPVRRNRPLSRREP